MSEVLEESCYLGWPLALVKQDCTRKGILFHIAWTAAEREHVVTEAAEAFVVRQQLSAEGIYQFMAVSKNRKEVQESGL